ncbi:hypothetical protein HU200_025343 [Digitaria exilis]|uniref:Endonuclease/exonuclease/phosphatase domain-containing protein n=1 Tax=Digitaria exilis TaxID=1010633 RepID=A0A835C137_9POAL|nr:hypothetical protein HU200_025343 [Digitaria exilis]
MIQSTQPKLVCLQESKLEEISDNLGKEFLGQRLSHFIYLPATGVRGGIVLAWDDDYICTAGHLRREFSLTTTVTMRLTNVSFLLTVVYGPATDLDKPRFLAELEEIKPAGNILWLCLGDFNLIYSAEDKNNLNLNRRFMTLFRRTLDRCELLEITLQNRKYTWSNERECSTLVRLDRAFCNKEWGLAFPSVCLHALSSSASDHCPLFLSQIRQQPRKERFKFENFWIKVPGFQEVIKNAWESPVSGISPLNILHHKLSNTAKALRAWSSSLFGEAMLQFHMAQEIILRLDMAQDTRTLTQDETELRRALKVRVQGLAAVERSRRRQCSRLTWLKEGDACTKFFHLKANARKRKNFIPCLKKADGTIIWSHEEKEAEIANHFQNTLGRKETRSCSFSWEDLELATVQLSTLDAPFTEEEIWGAISQMPSEKAPGPC